MPATTPELGFPYPLDSEPNNVPGDMGSLAQSVETFLVDNGLTGEVYSTKGSVSTTFSIPDTTPTAITTYGTFSGSATPTPYWSYSAGVYTILVAGVYDLNAQVIWDNNATGIRAAFIVRNAGSVASSRVNASVAGSTRHSVIAAGISLSVSDTIFLQAAQESTAPLNVTSGTYLTITRRGALAA